MAIDRFAGHGSGLTAPADQAASITPNDGADLPLATRGIYVGAGGNLAVILQGSALPVTFVGVPTGTLLPVRAARVLATGTTAGSLVALS